MTDVRLEHRHQPSPHSAGRPWLACSRWAAGGLDEEITRDSLSQRERKVGTEQESFNPHPLVLNFFVQRLIHVFVRFRFDNLRILIVQDGLCSKHNPRDHKENPKNVSRDDPGRTPCTIRQGLSRAHGKPVERWYCRKERNAQTIIENMNNCNLQSHNLIPPRDCGGRHQGCYRGDDIGSQSKGIDLGEGEDSGASHGHNQNGREGRGLDYQGCHQP